MMFKKRKGWVIAFCMLVMFLTIPAIQTEAAPAKAKALKAYKSFLSKDQLAWDKNWKVPASDCKFSIVYLDNNKTPELILYNTSVPHMGGYGRIFTYKNGKVKRVGAIDMDNGKFYYYKKKGVFISCYGNGGSFDNYRKIEKGKIVHKLQKAKELPKLKTKYYDSKKEISKSAFNKKLKKLVGSKKKTKAKFHKNTSSARNKYCR